ncbi:hypothetical protein GCM10011390_14390 [Aureimonas endophytica]|uniref:NADPH-dependent FMN reductase-like domain-containing protein n=1 Tax=Aureimonas endophytica TaxID=2027858 RepID=A0A916ZGR9_9HYPH|nr:NAD(P)H-dependent oxidoreductase [Aureimonas endophytica]GGD96730.1 hypothetical protein GCM10011390_14390 [Aureimonas endophytica]
MTARILVLPGTLEPGSPNRLLAFEIAKRLALTTAEVTVLDLEDYPLPVLDIETSDHELPPAALRLAERLLLQDALVLVAPEANGSLAPLPKNALDWAAHAARAVAPSPRSAVFRGLLVALASGLPGPDRSFAALDAWSPVFAALGADVLDEKAVPVMLSQAGEPVDPGADLDAFIAVLIDEVALRGRHQL